MKKLSLLIIILLTLGCNSEPIRIGTELSDLPTPSISELEKNQNFHDQQIELNGYYNSRFEMSGLFERKLFGPNKSVWVDFSRNFREQINDSLVNELQGRKLRVQGTFDIKNTGHLMQYLGTIELNYLETLN
jgi:hypothetical protein